MWTDNGPGVSKLLRLLRTGAGLEKIIKSYDHRLVVHRQKLLGIEHEKGIKADTHTAG